MLSYSFQGLATRRMAKALFLPAHAHVHDRYRVVAEDVHHLDRDLPPPRRRALFRGHPPMKSMDRITGQWIPKARTKIILDYPL
jgi:hypothetical protein